MGHVRSAELGLRGRASTTESRTAVSRATTGGGCDDGSCAVLPWMTKDKQHPQDRYLKLQLFPSKQSSCPEKSDGGEASSGAVLTVCDVVLDPTTLRHLSPSAPSNRIPARPFLPPPPPPPPSTPGLGDLDAILEGQGPREAERRVLSQAQAHRTGGLVQGGVALLRPELLHRRHGAHEDGRLAHLLSRFFF